MVLAFNCMDYLTGSYGKYAVIDL